MRLSAPVSLLRLLGQQQTPVKPAPQSGQKAPSSPRGLLCPRACLLLPPLARRLRCRISGGWNHVVSVSRIWIRLRCVNLCFTPLAADSRLFQKDLTVFPPVHPSKAPWLFPVSLVALYLREERLGHMLAGRLALKTKGPVLSQSAVRGVRKFPPRVAPHPCRCLVWFVF